MSGGRYNILVNKERGASPKGVDKMEYKVTNLKPWMVEKFYGNLSEQKRYILQVADNPDGKVVRETEKAVYIEFVCDFGKMGYWFPKSAFMTDEEKVNTVKQTAENKQEHAERYQSLIKFAKEHGLAVRNRMKVSTILAKIHEAGLTYEY